MGNALRCLLVTAAGLALLPAAALGAAVERDAETGIITIVDQNGAAHITVDRASSSDILVKDPNGGLSSTTCTPSPDATLVTCSSGSSIAVDLGGGADVFNGSSVSVPMSVAGGAGNDTLTTGGASDVLAGGESNDTLNGGPGVDEYLGETGDDTIKARDSNA